MKVFKKYSGLLFVGDPHVSFYRVGRRTDVHLGTTILNKIEQAVKIANERNLYLVFLGDLFDLKHEQNFSMVTKLTRILKELSDPPVTVEGNHEKTQEILSDDVALQCMIVSESIYTVGNNKLWGQFVINGENFYLGGTQYGKHIPEVVKLPAKAAPGKIIWLSHESLDFGKTYPGIVPLEEIEGVSMLVNGHIHDTQPPKKVGEMMAHNPGNITRQSMDAKDHVPAVWQWKPEQGFDLEKIVLEYEKDVFNMTGYQVEGETPSEIIKDGSIQSTNDFIDSMVSLQNDPKKTTDGSYMCHAISNYSKATNVSQEFTQKIMTFLDAVTIDRVNDDEDDS